MSGEFFMPFFWADCVRKSGNKCKTTRMVFSSPELKAQVSYSDRRLSVVCPSVCKLLHFDFFSRTTGPISTRLGTNHPWGEGFQVCSNKGGRPSPRGDNSKRVKMQ